MISTYNVRLQFTTPRSTATYSTAWASQALPRSPPSILTFLSSAAGRLEDDSAQLSFSLGIALMQREPPYLRSHPLPEESHIQCLYSVGMRRATPPLLQDGINLKSQPYLLQNSPGFCCNCIAIQLLQFYRCWSWEYTSANHLHKNLHLSVCFLEKPT